MKFSFISGDKGRSEQTSVPDIQSEYRRVLAEDGVNYVPQSLALLRYLPFMNRLRKEISISALSKIEGLAALYCALAEVQSYKGFVGVVTLYIKTHNTESILCQTRDIVKTLFSDYGPQSSGRPKWLEGMSLALTDWKLLLNSPTFSKVSRVLTLMVTLGIMEKKVVNMGNFEMFAIEAQTRQANAADLIDAVCETVVHFAEGAYQCFTTGTLRPLIFSSNDIVKMEEQYIEKLEEWEYVRNGNLSIYTTKTESQFDRELQDLIQKLSEMYKTMPNGVEKRIVQQKWEALAKIRTEFISVRVSGGLRKAPYCVKIYGDSGVGKSTFADITMQVVLKTMGLPCTSDYICTLNDSDKYMSTYRSYITGIKIDDFGNTKKDFWEASPSSWIIKICNNIREYAVMADIANKGKVTIEPGCLTITTNVEDLHAGVCSYNSMSILRRAHTHVELKVRPKYLTNNRLDTDKVIVDFGNLEQLNDIWLITLKQPVGNTSSTQAFSSWKIIHKDIDIFEYMSYLTEEVKRHNYAQDKIVDAFREPSNIVKFCAVCKVCAHDCVCEMGPQYGERLANLITRKCKDAKMDFRIARAAFETNLEDLALDTLIAACKSFWKSPYVYWTSWLPDAWLSHPLCKLFVLWTGSTYLKKDIWWSKFYVKIAYFFVCLCTLVHAPRFFFLIFVLGGVYAFSLLANMETARSNAYFDEIVRRRGSLHAAFVSARETHGHYACGLFAGLTVLYGAVHVVRAIRDSVKIQGILQPRSVDDIRARDAEVNPWKAAVMQMPISGAQLTSGKKDNVTRVEKFIAVAEVDGKFSNALIIRSRIVMLPLHLMPDKTVEAVIIYRGNRWKFWLNPARVSPVGDCDAVLAYVPNMPPMNDIVPFFYNTPLTRPIACTLVGIDPGFNAFHSTLVWTQVPEVDNKFMTMPGSYYTLTENTFGGLCMAPIITNNEHSNIVGVHIGGVTGTNSGCGISILSDDLTQAISRLGAMSCSFMPGAEATELDDSVYGKQYAISEAVHPKCPSNYITGNCDLEVYGTVTGRVNTVSRVIKTPISDIVEDVCGVPNQWGPPRFADPVKLPDGRIDKQMWKPWFASLEVCSKPSIGFDPVKVEEAMVDYMAEIDQTFWSQKEMWLVDVRPLNEVEIVSGIDGKRFIDAMPSSTSMGYPLAGPKNRYLVDLEPTDENAVPRTFVPEIWAEVAHLEERASKGQSLNQIFGAALKDEATKLSKDKVRVFQAAPVALQILIRKYFLPVARFLSMNPIISECAVGINAHGPEWHELSEFMSSFGEDRIIAGDYSKYDLRMPAQLTTAAFSVMIRIAILSGNYDDNDLKCMFVIAHEVVTPLTAYNGTLMRFLGTNPSGQNMTVYINSIVNSLLHRIAFRECYSQDELEAIGRKLGLRRAARFRDLVALSTYGDDAKGSVRKGYDKFNHISMGQCMAANDIVYTMPDKESEPVPFMNRFEADFLKRRDRYDEDLGCYVGMLDENSIFKSLHCIIKSKVVPAEDVAAMNIQGALREWFFHGREVYEKRRAQMKEVALRANYTIPDVDFDYDYKIVEWKAKYQPETLPS